MSWRDYFNKTKGRPTRALLLKGLELCEKDFNPTDLKIAIDLGSGAGVESLELLRRGWHVFAIDNNAEALNTLKSFSAENGLNKLETLQKGFEEIQELPRANLLHASRSLPFCKENFWPNLWKAIETSVCENGWIIADFFGPEDDWVKAKEVTGHSPNEIRKLFNGYEIKWFDEEKGSKQTVLGPEKFGHLISVIARRKG
jgi:tellurite methyltransferase